MAAEGLVVAVRVDGELADQLAGGGVDDADVQVADEHQDGVRAFSAPVPMGGVFPLTRRMSLPAGSVRSVRTRSWVSAARSPGWALGRAACQERPDWSRPAIGPPLMRLRDAITAERIPRPGCRLLAALPVARPSVSSGLNPPIRCPSQLRIMPGRCELARVSARPRLVGRSGRSGHAEVQRWSTGGAPP